MIKQAWWKLFFLILLATASIEVAEGHLLLSKQPDKTWLGPIVDGEGKAVKTSNLILVDDQLFFLSADALWQTTNDLASGKKIVLKKYAPPNGMVDKLPISEFTNFVYLPNRFVVLDKSGNLFEFANQTKTWRLYRDLRSIGSKPDPDYVDLCYGTILNSATKMICLLDPERNQIWQVNNEGTSVTPTFKEILPWRLKPGELNLSDGIGIAYDGHIYVLKYNGNIMRIEGPTWHHLSKMRPSRIFTEKGLPIFVVERENNRILSIDKATGAAKQFLFAAKSDLRGLYADENGFWVIDGNYLIHRDLKAGIKPSTRVNIKRIDSRLDGLSLPITGIRLPRHPGVFPGARRLYRFGVHKGVDFFNEPGCSTKVTVGTAVKAADAGKVIRADVNFREMSPNEYIRAERQCRASHVCSEQNEDLFRGRQVWLDHGNGLVTRYAHLSKIKGGIKSGDFIEAGKTLGYVGVSGTGENPMAKTIHPHLHFEIFLDGKYLGWGLNPAETRGVYEDIFGTGCRN